MTGSYIPVLPSSLLDFAGDEIDMMSRNFGDYSLKKGVVIKTYPIDHKNNISKHTVEYDVMAFVQNEDMGVASVTYPNCTIMSNFGGIGDFTEYTLRQPKNPPKKSKNPQEENGSTVLLLCLDGDQSRGIIIGSLGHVKRKSVLTKEAGHHLEGEFNGLNWKVDKDGAFTITFKSATDNDGKVADEKAGGTHLQIDKTGQVDINTNLEGEEETYIRMDKANKDIGLKAGANIGLTAKKAIGLNAGTDVNVEAKEGNLLAKAGGTATMESGGAFTIKAGGAMQIETPELQIKADAGVTVKGQQILVDSPLIQLGNGGTPALVLSTQFLGVGNLGQPVVSQAIGPFSSSVFVGP